MSSRPKLKDRHIEFRRDFTDAPTAFELDANMMRTALINILDNAVDACAADTAKPDHQITFRVKGADGALTLAVQDTGPGMDAETKDKIFDLFFSSKGTKGTGFGLFITQNIVKQHRGSIKVHSVKGKGRSL
jgi:signal transduction histidine kinase